MGSFKPAKRSCLGCLRRHAVGRLSVHKPRALQYESSSSHAAKTRKSMYMYVMSQRPLVTVKKCINQVSKSQSWTCNALLHTRWHASTYPLTSVCPHAPMHPNRSPATQPRHRTNTHHNTT